MVTTHVHEEPHLTIGDVAAGQEIDPRGREKRSFAGAATVRRDPFGVSLPLRGYLQSGYALLPISPQRHFLIQIVALFSPRLSRRRSDNFKNRAIAASLDPGVNISALARSLEITPSQLFGWRGAAAKRVAKAERRTTTEPSGAKARRVEIEIGGAVLRVPADIGEEDLRRFLRAVREA